MIPAESERRYAMNSDDDIPVLRDAVARKPARGLEPAQIDELCEELSAGAQALVEHLVEQALQENMQILRTRLKNELSSELPALIEKTVSEKLKAD